MIYRTNKKNKTETLDKKLEQELIRSASHSGYRSVERIMADILAKNLNYSSLHSAANISRHTTKNILKESYTFSKDLVKTAYGLIAGIMRIPTSIRKLRNDQIDYPEHGSILRMISGLCIGGLAAEYSLISAPENNNYWPAAIFLGTNLLSGAYELGRLKQSRIEYNIMKSNDKDAKDD